MKLIHDRLQVSFELYEDLVVSIEEEQLKSKLGTLPSNSIGLQLWCVVGARKSYAKAIEADEWRGFSCSLELVNDPAQVAEAMRRSEQSVTSVIDRVEELSESQLLLLIKLLEHEVAHHGQLIRYLCGLKLMIPESWKSRYALD